MLCKPFQTQLHFQCHAVFTLPSTQLHFQCHAVFTLPSTQLHFQCHTVFTLPATQLHFQCHAVFTLFSRCPQHSSTFSATLFSRCPVLKKGALGKSGNGVPTSDASVSWQHQPKNHQRFSPTYTWRCTHMFQPPPHPPTLFFFFLLPFFFLANSFPSRSKGAGVYSCVWSWHCTYKKEHVHGLTVTVTLSHNPHFSVQP